MITEAAVSERERESAMPRLLRCYGRWASREQRFLIPAASAARRSQLRSLWAAK